MVSNFSLDDLSVLLGNGDGTFESPIGYDTGNGPSSVALGDFDGDGDVDLANTNKFDDSVSVLAGAGDETFGSAIGYVVGGAPTSVAVTDVDGDDVVDVVTANDDDESVSVLAGAGDGTLKDHKDYSVGGSPRGVAAADVDGDSVPDLVTANRNENSLSLLVGDGGGGYADYVDYIPGEGPEAVTIADFNADGRGDVASANGGGDSVSVLLGPAPADTTAPDTEFRSGPAEGRSINRDTATFEFASEPDGDAERFECSLDGAAYTGCVSPVTYRKLSNAKHEVRVRAIDAAGNTDATPATRTFRVARNAFKVRARAQQLTKKGKVRVALVLPGPGTATGKGKGSPVAKKKVRIKAEGVKKVTLSPTKKGLNKLRQSRANRSGPGKLKVRVKWIYRPVGATSNNNKTRRYILKLK